MAQEELRRPMEPQNLSQSQSQSQSQVQVQVQGQTDVDADADADVDAKAKDPWPLLSNGANFPPNGGGAKVGAASWPELFVSWPGTLLRCLHPDVAPSAQPMIMSNMFYDIWR
ncbi:GL16008 [Drosophila persimilis]|uniref:GL16008 n=1 Tax=Drosophila persimilis TaxID=7234 RepID=B4GQE3_DROPE|nr:GL16008 [Drosophila persimilis]